MLEHSFEKLGYLETIIILQLIGWNSSTPIRRVQTWWRFPIMNPEITRFEKKENRDIENRDIELYFHDLQKKCMVFWTETGIDVLDHTYVLKIVR